jgi:hypothetical protein
MFRTAKTCYSFHLKSLKYTDVVQQKSTIYIDMKHMFYIEFREKFYNHRKIKLNKIFYQICFFFN